MQSELVNDRVIGIPVSATLVSMIQLLNYCSVCLIFTFNDHSPMTGIRSVTDISHPEYSMNDHHQNAKYTIQINSRQIFVWTNAIIIVVTAFAKLRKSDYLMLWVLQTSLQPLVFLYRLVNDVIRMDLSAFALTLTSNGLQFILSLYFIHLMLALHKKLTHRHSYMRLDLDMVAQEKEKYSAIIREKGKVVMQGVVFGFLVFHFL